MMTAEAWVALIVGLIGAACVVVPLLVGAWWHLSSKQTVNTLITQDNQETLDSFVATQGRTNTEFYKLHHDCDKTMALMGLTVSSIQATVASLAQRGDKTSHDIKNLQNAQALREELDARLEKLKHRKPGDSGIQRGGS